MVAYLQRLGNLNFPKSAFGGSEDENVVWKGLTQLANRRSEQRRQMLNGKGRTVSESGLAVLDGRCCHGQRRQFIKGSGTTTAVAGTQRGAKVVAMLVRWTVVRFGKGGSFATAGTGIMPVLAVAAREAGQGKDVQAEYAEKPLHVTKVTAFQKDCFFLWPLTFIAAFPMKAPG